MYLAQSLKVVVVSTFSMMFFVLAGCSESDPRLPVEIIGVINLDGTPLKQGSVHFTSPISGESTYTNLDGNGRYTLSFPKADLGSEYEIIVTPPVIDEQDAHALENTPPHQKWKGPSPKNTLIVPRAA